jgi:mono/diheme cytochrome c family protein
MVRLALALALVTCSSPPHWPHASPAVAVLPDVPFAQLDHAQRIQFMKERVVPAMAPVFRAHDAKRFAQFGCATCHGEPADARRFEMPNPDLPELDLHDLARHEARDVEWMKTSVAPTMRGLLGADRFGCANCHPVATTADN